MNKEDVVDDDDFEIIRGSGNIFRDFGHANADLEHARAILAKEIIQELDEQCLSTREAEKLTGVAHSEFSRIRNAKLSRFTLDRMITIFGKLAKEVEVSVSVRPRSHADVGGLSLNIPHMPKSLHSSLTNEAVQEGVPLEVVVLNRLYVNASASVDNQFAALTEVVKTVGSAINGRLMQTTAAIVAIPTAIAGAEYINKNNNLNNKKADAQTKPTLYLVA